MNSENEICRASDSECTDLERHRNELRRVKPHYSSEYTAEEWQVKVTLPGVEKSDAKISMENEILEVSALRKFELPENWERLTGSETDRLYELRLDVGPEVDDSKVEAKMEDGELLIRLPLKEEAKPRAIPVH